MPVGKKTLKHRRAEHVARRVNHKQGECFHLRLNVVLRQAFINMSDGVGAEVRPTTVEEDSTNKNPSALRLRVA